jgi:HlyD family secretion protein
MKQISDFFKKIWKWITGSTKHKITFAACCAAAVAAVIIAEVIMNAASDDYADVTYRETKAVKGALTVGVEEDGTIAVGTTSQTFDIDLSAYSTSSDSSSYSWAGGGSSSSGGGMGGMQNGNSSSSGSSDTSTTASGTRQLQVEDVYVSVGQNIKKGDKLLKLTESSVNTIRGDLEEDVNNAKLTYQKQQTQKTLSDLSDKQQLETDKSYGSYAQTQYDLTVQQLQDAVTDAQTTLDDANDDMKDLQDELTEMQSHVTTYAKLKENAEYSKKTTDMESSLYWWLVAENAREEASDMVDTLTDNIEKQEKLIKTQQAEIDKDTNALTDAQEALELGLVTAKAEYDKDELDYDNAEELYDVGTGQTQLTTDEASDDYSDTKQKLDDFDSTVQDQVIYSDYDGVVTAVGPSADDYIGTDSKIITVNDYDKTTVEVSVPEDDMTDIKEGSTANVYCPALPDNTFAATVTDVGDATYDSSTSTTSYDVTVTLSGDTSVLFAGMTADVTFITKQTKNVVYVSNRAIQRDDGNSYVLMKDSDGNIVKKQVTTGFSDGSNVEIKSGLSDGDVVLIESKVSGTAD